VMFLEDVNGAPQIDLVACFAGNPELPAESR
jgi:hypothetical protein